MINTNFRNNRTIVPVDKIISLYNSGISVKQLSIQFGCSRNVINNRLLKANIKHRNRSESMFNRTSKMTIEERKSMVYKANEGMRNSTSEQIKRRLELAAKTTQNNLSEVGQLEDYVMSSLNNFSPIPQLAESTYNIDIACRPVAIEVHVNSGFPHNMPHIKKRIKHLLKCGWVVIYIKVGAKVIINEVAMNKIISVIEFSRLNPSFRGKYWVIRGTGEGCAIGCLDSDNISIIETSENLLDMFRVNLA